MPRLSASGVDTRRESVGSSRRMARSKPSSYRSTIRSVRRRSKPTCGCRRLNSAMAGATCLRPNGAGAVSRMTPRSVSSSPWPTCWISSRMDSTERARAAMERPSSVMRRLRVLRSKRGVPSAFSSRAICLLTVFGSSCRLRAAAEKLALSATRTRTCRSSRFRKDIDTSCPICAVLL